MLKELQYDLIFDREISKTKDFISSNGYEIESNKETIPFDFMDYYAAIDVCDPSVLHVEHCILDCDSFPESKNITPESIKNALFTEFSIDAESKNLQLEAVKNMCFRFDDGISILSTEELEKTARDTWCQSVAW